MQTDNECTIVQQKHVILLNDNKYIDKIYNVVYGSFAVFSYGETETQGNKDT